MATLVFSALGTLIGGPVGGAIGAVIGSQVDGAILGGGGRREGPRVKELAVTTSSYGQPIARHYGRMRVAGSIVWATDLVENRETSGGGKGQPKVTAYSYSSSFAVALASRPIEGVGRIWADGNLLRGAAGDLKAGGALRIYTGHGDQAPDPLIAADKGSQCPAFRNCAYVVFDGLELADFGNRIPALSFEVFADGAPLALEAMIEPLASEAQANVDLNALAGFSYDGGSLRASIEAIGTLFPLACDTAGNGLRISGIDDASNPASLPEPSVSPGEGDFGAATGRKRERGAASTVPPDSVLYYDLARDYQPGLQRAAARATDAGSHSAEFPGALSADTARGLIDAAARRARWVGDSQNYRLAELDAALGPGSIVATAGDAGSWRVTAWEWRESGVELELARTPPISTSTSTGEAGAPGLPPDVLPGSTRLRGFELPWDGLGDPATPRLYAAASATTPAWRGAALYADRAGVLDPLGPTGRTRSLGGTLAEALGPSPAMRFEPDSVLWVDLVAEDLDLAPATLEGIADGANRILVGGEILQFAEAEREGGTRWRLRGLLRGRGGTEPAALAGHGAGAAATLLDDSLVALSAARTGGTVGSIAAIGSADSEPVTAAIEGLGRSRRPLVPVHARARIDGEGALVLSWIRRARGGWAWVGGIDEPLVEEAERYLVGAGDTDSPVMSWDVGRPALTIAAGDYAALLAVHAGQTLWVRQVGSYAMSDPLHLVALP